jgi:hypothetical protein
LVTHLVYGTVFSEDILKCNLQIVQRICILTFTEIVLMCTAADDVTNTQRFELLTTYRVSFESFYSSASEWSYVRGILPRLYLRSLV